MPARPASRHTGGRSGASWDGPATGHIPQFTTRPELARPSPAVASPRRLSGRAARAHPALPAISWGTGSVAELSRHHWPCSAEVYRPGGTVPAPGSRSATPPLAGTSQHIPEEAEATSGDRDDQIEAARRVY